jgi:hypothetical protein
MTYGVNLTPFSSAPQKVAVRVTPSRVCCMKSMSKTKLPSECTIIPPA